MLQAFAWGRMMTHYVRSESLGAAVSDTFSGEMCSICRMVAAAHQQEQSRSPVAPLKLESKILLFFQSSPAVAIADRPGVLLGSPAAKMHSCDRALPPVPPPRGAVA
jgi:hypothetical protein